MIEEVCNVSQTEKLPNEDLVYLEHYVKEFSATRVYTHRASSKDRLTNKVCKSMTRNVKSLAYNTLLKEEHNGESGENNERFVRDDEQIFNFAKDDLAKNTATKIPARLFRQISAHINAIGQIVCGQVQGTCWLVTDMEVITNHHVYRMINNERQKLGNETLPITVTFDYLSPGTEGQVVKVDETRGDILPGSSEVDYIMLRLKEDESIRGRNPLGPIVRSRPLQEGLVIIVGHPEGEEMYQETCVVVRTLAWRENLTERHYQFVGVHMTNTQRLEYSEKYKSCLPYDTSLFSGASGSPIFDLDGKIVAMHTQGYTLKVPGGKCSLMEFGVQFGAICEDLRRRNVDVDRFFPNYELGKNEEKMEVDN